MSAGPSPCGESWRNVRRLLCIRLDNMGDVLMSSPAMRALHETWPACRITLLAAPAGVAIARHLGCVHDCISYAAPWVKQAEATDVAADHAMLARLRAQAFDAAVIFTVYSQSALPAALMCRLAGIPRVLAHARENPYGLLSDWAPDREPEDGGRHEVQRQLDLVATVGAHTADPRMRLVAPAEAHASLDEVLVRHGLPAAGWVALHPGASAPSRRYPAEAFAAAVAQLDPALEVVYTGSASEAALAESVRVAAGRGVNLAGQLDLGALIALIARARVLVSNNSGPVHIAAATATPVVDLYALTNPQHTPWQVESRVLYQDVPCRYCYRSVCPEGHHACLVGVTPAQVAAATHDLVLRRAPA